ncbi:MAG TPA: response regulator transcription factor [Opitutaceae bacterium]
MNRLLVIDDDAALRQRCAALLRLEGFEVIEAGDGRDGLAAARRHKPDLVICDIQMPGPDGHEVLRTLRDDPVVGDVPFVFLTGLGAMPDLRRGMNLGADDYLVKPVEPAELVAAVRARLQRLQAPAAAANGTEPKTAAALEALGLTPREAEVLYWVAQGKSNPEIVIIMGVQLTTVKKHLESIFAKLGVENRTTAAAMALERLR